MKSFIPHKKTLIPILLFLSLYFVILLLIPENYDDWAWGSRVGLHRLMRGFLGYNGRHLGNLTIMFLTRIPVMVASLLKVVVVFGIIYLCSGMLKYRSLLLFVLLGILLMPRPMLTQTFCWSAGFSNYVTSVFFLFLFMVWVNQYYDISEMSKFRLFLIFILSICMQLYLETSTLCLLFCSVITTVYYRVIKKKFHKIYGIILLGNIIGFLLMFTNTAYFNAVEGNDKTYKSLQFSVDNVLMLKQLWWKFSQSIIPQWLTENTFLLFSLTGTILLFCFFFSFKGRNFFLSFNLLSFLYFFGRKVLFLLLKAKVPMDNEICTVVCLLFYINLVLCICFAIKDSKQKLLLLLPLLAQLPLTGPLLFSSPINTRCFMPGYMLFMLFILELLNLTLKELSLSNYPFYNVSKNLSYIVITIFFVLFITNDINHCVILHNAQKEKIEYINSELGNNKQTIVVPYLPYSDIYCVNSNPTKNRWQTKFNIYYNFPNDTRYHYVSYSKWLKIK